MSITSKLKCYIILICLIIVSCNNTNKQQIDFKKDKHEIISLLIQKLPPGPPPPTPPPGVYKKDTIAFNKYVDSIYKLDVGIAILDYFIVSEKPSIHFKNSLDKDFKPLLEQLETKQPKNPKIDLNLLKISKNRNLIPIEKPFKNLYKELDVSYYIAFSDVIINKARDKAIVYTIENTSRLSGSTDIYLLQMENGKWKIIKRETLSIT